MRNHKFISVDVKKKLDLIMVGGNDTIRDKVAHGVVIEWLCAALNDEWWFPHIGIFLQLILATIKSCKIESKSER